MKKYIILSTIFVLLAVLIISVEARTWTSGKHSIEGEFLGLVSNGTIVHIQKTDGTNVKIPLDKLSQEDQNFVQKQNWYAFIVGVDTYDDESIYPLKCCVSDANELAEKLKKIGFPEENITLLVDSIKIKYRPSKENIENKLQELTSKLPENSLIIFSFAGHGIELEGRGSCFLPTDVDQTQLASTVISVRDVSNMLEKSKAQVKLMLVDACRENITRGIKNLHGFNKVDTPKGLAVLQSCSDGESACEDRANGHGYFTLAFLEALDGKADSNNDGIVTLNEVFSYTSKQTEVRVQKDCSATQRPFYSFNGATIQNFPFVTGLLVDGLTRAQRDKAEKLYEEADHAFTIEDYKLAQEKINKAIEIYGKNEKYKKLKKHIDTAVDREAKKQRLVAQAQAAQDAQKEAEAKKQRLAEEKRQVEQKAQAKAEARKEADKQARLDAQKKADEQRQLAEEKRQADLKAHVEAEARKQAEEQARLAKQKPIIPAGNYAGERMVKTVNGVEFAFRWCPAGTFMMGSPESEKDRDNDETQHKVTLTQGFWMMETEVTQKQWEVIMGISIHDQVKLGTWGQSLSGVGDNYPVYYISWNDCQEFCKKCSELGLSVCLPTEAQWEYACRAGTTEPYAGNLDEMAWEYDDNHNRKMHPVGTKKANAWNLYDMHGNVWEWCADWYTRKYYGFDATDPVGPSSGRSRMYRGGHWDAPQKFCRSANRGGNAPEMRAYCMGFRVVLNGRPMLSVTPSTTSPTPSSSSKEQQAGDRMVKTVNGVEFAFRWCPPGKFMMGTSEPEHQPEEELHQETIKQGFWMLETEITVGMWEAIMNENTTEAKNMFPKYPLSQNEAFEFCEKFSQITGLNISLPSNAQWEYACRAGTTTVYYFGDDPNMLYKYGNFRTANDGFAGGAPVRSYPPNPWGLYDMYGNVHEWTTSQNCARGGAFDSPIERFTTVFYHPNRWIRLGLRIICTDESTTEVSQNVTDTN